jgi:hypothetical protein
VAHTIIVKKSAREIAERARTQQGPLRGQLSAIVRSSGDAADLARQLGGRDVKPRRPVMVDTGGTRTLIVGDGDATAAELADLAARTVEKHEPDFGALRERAGLMRREEVDSAIRNALRDRVKQHQANPLSDPPRKVQYYPGTRK